MKHPKITLRYFDVRARAQFLRYFFLVRNIEFTDDRIEVDEGFETWLEIREDRSISGPFAKLPVLHWGDETIAEALVIAAFLHKSFGDEATLTQEQNLRHSMLLSTIYMDVVTPLAMLLWAQVLFEGVNFPNLVTATYRRIRGHLRSIDMTLTEWSWTASMLSRPIMIVDCMLWEAIDVFATIFGDRADIKEFPALRAVHERYRQGTAFRQLLDEKPVPFTARPGEAQAIEEIQSLLGQ